LCVVPNFSGNMLVSNQVQLEENEILF